MPLTRILLDSMIFDLLVEQPVLLQLLNDLSAKGEIVVLTTHIQEDEIAAVRDLKKRAELQCVFKHLAQNKISTSGAVWNVSKWGESTWGDGAGDIKCEHIVKANPVHAQDALIAMTASAGADILVTEDQTLRKRIFARQTALEVLDFEAFRQHIHNL